MKTLELKPSDLPVSVRFDGPEGIRNYLLDKTRQGKLVMTKPIEDTGKENR
jgi:hemin uptake protein HemP